MIDELKPYPAYKDSGVSSLGKVPAHWGVTRLKQICRFNYGDALPAENRQEGSVPVFGSNGCVGSHSISNTETPCIVIGRKGSFGKVNFSDKPVFAIDTTFFIDGRLTSANIRWVAYLLGLLGLDDVSRDSAVPGLDREEAYQNVCPLPPLDEQASIVQFLGYADRRIRRYIHAKQKLIKFLEEQKRGIVHRTITHGLDPNVRLNPSGVEWLGNVPEHWEVVPLKFLSRRIQNGATPPTSEEFFYEGGTTPWFGPSSIGTSVEVSAPVRYLADSAFVAGKARLIQGPAVLIVVIGATAGRMALLSGEGSTNQQLTAFELRTDVVMPEFAIHQLRSAENWLRATASTATIPILDSGTVSRLSVAVPPLFDEQAAIVSFLEDATANTDSTINRAKQEISLLGEYRTRLIADVVTGKLDVREAAANLPDEISQEETVLDDAAEWFEDDLEDSDSSVEVALEEVDA